MSKEAEYKVRPGTKVKVVVNQEFWLEDYTGEYEVVEDPQQAQLEYTYGSGAITVNHPEHGLIAFVEGEYEVVE